MKFRDRIKGDGSGHDESEKRYFYLIDYDFISYQGEKRVYALKDEGWKLLSMIKRTRKYGHMCYRTDIVSKCEKVVNY